MYGTDLKFHSFQLLDCIILGNYFAIEEAQACHESLVVQKRGQGLAWTNPSCLKEKAKKNLQNNIFGNGSQEEHMERGN